MERRSDHYVSERRSIIAFLQAMPAVMARLTFRRSMHISRAIARWL
jgi:hypothetical protein